MKEIKKLKLVFPPLIFILLFGCQAVQQKQVEQVSPVKTDPLPSWNEGTAKQSIISFVEAVTSETGPDFIKPADRIAVFDNDGTLWTEQPYYFQLQFGIDRVKALAPAHPEWRTNKLIQAVLADDINTVLSFGEKGLMELIMTTHAGITTDEFSQIVKDWINTAKHPKTGKLYKEMVFQPMLEVLDYLRANGFKTFIVSGGGIDFMRPWTEEVYGIPSEQVIGSSIKTAFEMREGNPVLMKLPEINFIDDKEGKPVGIHQHIGKQPLAAFGNSDGDLQMLQYTASNNLKSLCVYIHHTDSVREWAYDRNSHIGKLDKGLDEATEKSWTVVDMKNDWIKIY
jgi:phosphoglycolate phosphatase-like HAD superfamily hydrolase